MTAKDEILSGIATLTANSENMKEDIAEIKSNVNSIYGDMDELKVGYAFLKQHLKDDKRNKRLVVGAAFTTVAGLIIAGFAYLVNLGSNA